MLLGCSSYEKEEFKAIEDITNDYLKKNHLKEILNPDLNPPPPGCYSYDSSEYQEAKAPNIDSLDLKVYISDALMPIAQIKEDNEWMFRSNRYNKIDSIKYNEILNSNTFIKLKYREFNKRNIRFIKPYRYFDKYKESEVLLDTYSIFNFSRICFDSKRKYGIVVIDYKTGYENGTGSGYFMSYLIKKIEGKWTIIERINN